MNNPINQIRDAVNYFPIEGVSFFSELLKTTVESSMWILGSFEHELQIALNFMWLGFINDESFNFGGSVIGSRSYSLRNEEYQTFVADEANAAVLNDIENKARAMSMADSLTIPAQEGGSPVALETRNLAILPYSAHLSFQYFYPNSTAGYSFTRDASNGYHDIIAANAQTVFAVIEMAKAVSKLKDNFFNLP